MQVAYDHEQNSRGKNLDNAPDPETPQSIPHLTPPTSPRLQMPTLRPATDSAISQRRSNARHPVTASLSLRPGEQLIGIAREAIGKETEPLMNSDIEASQIVGSGRRWLPKFRPTACPRTHRKGDNVESGLSESSHGAGHVVGGGHQQKPIFWRRMDQIGSEARVLFRRLRMFLDQDPLGGDPKRDKVLLHDSRLARPRCRGICAPREN